MNRRRLGVIGLAVLACALAGPLAAQPVLRVPPMFQLPHRPPPPSLAFAYRGWRVDATAAARVQPAARTVRQIEAQIDLVERLNLRPEVIGFMRAQPVFGDAAPGAPGEAVVYQPGRGILLHVRRLDPRKPVLLYGALEAFAAQRLPGGFDNPELADLRRQAASRRVWPRDALMLQSNDQFFALTGAAYLYGAITREPYTRADLKKTEPQCYRWLANLFDPGRPRV
jgi:hypothetical protein